VLDPLIASRLKLPVIAAPMFRVSGPELVIAACKAGIIGAFPVANCRTSAMLDEWLSHIRSALGPHDAPFCPNLIMRRETLHEDLDCIMRHGAEMVITSVGSPAEVIPSLHEIGCRVFADVATVRHARKAIASGADGLVLLTAGAGGQTGWANGFAFVRAVRSFFDGPIILAGGISDGWSVFAAMSLGCDLAYMGTTFIATHESMAEEGYKRMLVECEFDDIMLSRAFTGLDTNTLVPSIRMTGLDPDNLPSGMAEERTAELYGRGGSSPIKRWKHVWSAGHSVSGVRAIGSVAGLVDRTASEFADAARASLRHSRPGSSQSGLATSCQEPQK